MLKKYLNSINMFCLILLATSCIEEFNLDNINNEAKLVVDGLITNQPGPYFIRLIKSKTGNFSGVGNQGQNIEFVNDAIVIVTDDSGQTDTLLPYDISVDEYNYNFLRGCYKTIFNTETAQQDTIFLNYITDYINNGFYATNHLQGIPGHTYYLEIQWNEKKYTASSYMPPVPDLDSIGYKKIKSEIGKDDRFLPCVYFSEPQGITNYYLFQLQDEKLYRSNSNYFRWEFMVIDDTYLKPYVNGLNVEVAALNGSSHFDIYMINSKIPISMSSLTLEAYCFYKALIDQFDNNGAYSPAPASPPGNISNGALGLFRASAKVTKEVIIREL